MNMMLFDRPAKGECLMPPTTQRVVNRMGALGEAIGGAIDLNVGRHVPLLGGTMVLPEANLVIAGTNCRRPLLFHEAQLIAQTWLRDVVLLRFDADRGASFDILLREGRDVLCGYLAWRQRGGDLWFIPAAGEGTFIRATRQGMICEKRPPFDLSEQRETGIIRAIHLPSLEGGGLTWRRKLLPLRAVKPRRLTMYRSMEGRALQSCAGSPRVTGIIRASRSHGSGGTGMARARASSPGFAGR